MTGIQRLDGPFEKRYVALGDSFTEGVGDIDPSSPNGVRGWADRVAAQLIENDPDWGYANLAIRGRKLGQVIDQQIEPALALEPTLVSIYAGGNDILRPMVNLDGILDRYRWAIHKLRDSGARVVLFTGFDSGKASIFRVTRGRTAIYNEQVRRIAVDLGCDVVDFWHMKQLQDWRYWDVDRMHLGINGHIAMAKEVLSVLGENDEIHVPELEAPTALSLPQKVTSEVSWTRDYLYPWMKRRVTGVSSGDEFRPKYPQLTRRIW